MIEAGIRRVNVTEGLCHGTLVREVDSQGNEQGPFMVIYSTFSSLGSFRYAHAIEIDTKGDEPVLSSNHLRIYPNQRLKFVGTFAIDEDDEHWSMCRRLINERFNVSETSISS